MRTKTLQGICVVLILLTMGTSSVDAAFQRKKKQAKAQQTKLNEKGQKLVERFNDMLAELKADISKALPPIDEQKKSAYTQTRKAEKAAEAEIKAAKKRIGEIGTAQALVGHAKGKWIGGADKGIAAANQKLKKATTEAERQTAQKELVKWQKNREDGVNALKERQANLEKLELQRPRLESELKKAEQDLVDAKAATLKAV